MEEKKKRYMRTLISENLRQLVKDVNDNDIQQEDIVALEKSGENVVLIYYK